MPVLKVWGRKNSSNVQKTMWTVGELGIPYERLDIGMEYGVNDTAAYLALNPNGLVPTIQDGDFVCGNRIRSFVISLRATALALSSPSICGAERWRANEWIGRSRYFCRPLPSVFWGLMRTPPEQRDLAAIAAATMNSIAAAKILDAALARNAYLAGQLLLHGRYPDGRFHVPLPRAGTGTSAIAKSGALVCRARNPASFSLACHRDSHHLTECRDPVTTLPADRVVSLLCWNTRRQGPPLHASACR